MACSKSADVGNGGALRIVLLGKTGMGKSSLGNALLGKEAPKGKTNEKRGERPTAAAVGSMEGFRVGRGLKSETFFCKWDRVRRCGVMLEVTDTPGLCDTHMDESLIYKELAKSVALAEPGPNVILYVLRCDRRFTKEEKEVYQKVKLLFSDEIKNYLILIFNGLDTFANEETLEEKRQCLAEEVEAYGEPLDTMVQEAGGRYMGMNNQANPEEVERQVQDLIHKMQGMVTSNGKDGCYKTELTEEILTKVEELSKAEAEDTDLSETEATNTVKRKIVEENVSPGFFQSISNAVYESAKSIAGGIRDICSVM